MVEESAVRPPVNGKASGQTAKMLTAQEVFAAALARTDREEHNLPKFGDDSERSSFVDALVHGRLIDQWSLWEVADCLRLPTCGPFVVIAVELPQVGTAALPDIESKLRSLDVLSAWCLLPEAQVGVVHFRTDDTLDDVLALLSRITTTHVGVSARFDDLGETAQAFRCARVTLRGRPDPGPLVSVFDASILATAAVSAPDVMTKLVAPMLQSFTQLAENEREILFETFRVWMEHDGSLRTTGEVLFCHPNTVRYRLHRIEHYTGRSLSRPRDVAELCLAFEVHRRLM